MPGFSKLSISPTYGGSWPCRCHALSPKRFTPRTGLAPCCRPRSRQGRQGRQERSLAPSLAPGLLARSRRCRCSQASSNPPGEGWGANSAPSRCRGARLRRADLPGDVTRGIAEGNCKVAVRRGMRSHLECVQRENLTTFPIHCSKCSADQSQRDNNTF